MRWMLIGIRCLRKFQKGHESGEQGASKFWIAIGVKIRIFYVTGPQDTEYWLGLGVRIRIFHVLGPHEV